MAYKKHEMWEIGQAKGLYWNYKAMCESIQRVSYVVIGGGSAAYYAAKSVILNDPKAKVLIISEHDYLPFSFETKGKNSFFLSEIIAAAQLEKSEVDSIISLPIFKECVPFDKLFEQTEAAVSFLMNSQVLNIDSEEKKLTLDGDAFIYYNKLILATERCIRKHKILSDLKLSDQNIIEVNTLEDYWKIVNLYKDQNKRVTVIGSSDHAYSLSVSLASEKSKGFTVHHIDEGQKSSFFKFLPEALANFLISAFNKKHLEVHRTSITDVQPSQKELNISLENGNNIKCDVVVVFNDKENTDDFIKGGKCTGSLCPKKHIDFPTGYAVDDHLRVNGSDIFAVGDNIVYHEPILDMYYQSSSFEQNINSSKIAARNATGLSDAYDYLPVLNFNLCDSIKFQTIGHISPDLKSTSVWKESKVVHNPAFGHGITFYHKDNIIVGILLWNISGKLSLCEEIILSKNNVSDAREVAKWLLPRSEFKDVYSPNKPGKPSSSDSLTPTPIESPLN